MGKRSRRLRGEQENDSEDYLQGRKDWQIGWQGSLREAYLGPAEQPQTENPTEWTLAVVHSRLECLCPIRTVQMSLYALLILPLYCASAETKWMAWIWNKS